MTDDFGPTGIDPDWYDHGPGSEEWRLKRRREQIKWDNAAYARKLCDRRIVKAAEALVRLLDEQKWYALTPCVPPDAERCCPELVALGKAVRAKEASNG